MNEKEKKNEFKDIRNKYELWRKLCRWDLRKRNMIWIILNNNL